MSNPKNVWLMNNTKNVGLFLRLLFSDPIEFFDRAKMILQSRKELLLRGYESGAYRDKICFADGLRALSDTLGQDLFEILAEPEHKNIENHIAGVTRALNARTDLPFPIIYNTDSTVAELVYSLSRALRPETVIETGVGFGVTSATILAALHKNGMGELHSVDLPPIGDRASRAHIGIMIPEEYKSRWHLHVGTSKRLLPSLFAQGISEIDLFIHGSATIYPIQKMEMDLAWPHISGRGAMIIDNIGRNPAFTEFVAKANVDYWRIIEQRSGNLTGIVLKREGLTERI